MLVLQVEVLSSHHWSGRASSRNWFGLLGVLDQLGGAFVELVGCLAGVLGRSRRIRGRLVGLACLRRDRPGRRGGSGCAGAPWRAAGGGAPGWAAGGAVLLAGAAESFGAGPRAGFVPVSAGPLFLAGVASGFEAGPGFGAASPDPDGALSGFGAAEPPDDPESLDGLEAALGFGPGPLPPEPPFGPPATPASGFSRAETLPRLVTHDRMVRGRPHGVSL